MPDTGAYNVSIGSVSGGNVAVGDHNTQTITTLSPAETSELRAAVERLRGLIRADTDAGDEREAALRQADELEDALVRDKPRAGRIRRVRDWFLDHLPDAAEAVTSLVLSPLVGKLVGVAGDAIAGEFRDLLGVDPSKEG